MQETQSTEIESTSKPGPDEQQAENEYRADVENKPDPVVKSTEQPEDFSLARSPHQFFASSPENENRELSENPPPIEDNAPEKPTILEAGERFYHAASAFTSLPPTTVEEHRKNAFEGATGYMDKMSHEMGVMMDNVVTGNVQGIEDGVDRIQSNTTEALNHIVTQKEQEFDEVVEAGKELGGALMDELTQPLTSFFADKEETNDDDSQYAP